VSAPEQQLFLGIVAVSSGIWPAALHGWQVKSGDAQNQPRQQRVFAHVPKGPESGVEHANTHSWFSAHLFEQHDELAAQALLMPVHASAPASLPPLDELDALDPPLLEDAPLEDPPELALPDAPEEPPLEDARPSGPPVAGAPSCSPD
jgi:hypothetical protein